MNGPARTWLAAFGLAALLELLSFLSFLAPYLRPGAMALLFAAAVVLAFMDLRLLLGLAVLEAVIGSHGHLLSADIGRMQLTVRMAIFGVLAAAWLVKQAGKKFSAVRMLDDRRLLAPLLLVVAAVAWGILRGLMLGRGLGTVVADGKAYAFMLMLPIALDIAASPKSRAWLAEVFVGALLWLAVKSLLLVYFFSHDFTSLLPDLYYWQRTFFLTEITQLGKDGWYRIFAASDVFLLIGLFAGILFETKKPRRLWAWLVPVIAAFLLCLSRSFWLGAALAAVVLIPLFMHRALLDPASVRRAFARLLATAVLASALILVLVKFPVPGAATDASMLSVFGSRLFDVSDAAVSSRWNMIPSLEKGIRGSPILGSGFGMTITYRSDDPRIQELYPGGVITTSAIEWQYLEIWLKMGLLGLVGMLWLLWSVGRRLGDAPAIAMAFLAFVIANVFTPYLNHPLGWMFMALALAAAGHSSTAPARSG